MQVWVVAMGAVYAFVLRPRLFAEREERRQQHEKEAADFRKYEEDWDRWEAVVEGWWGH